ncbi:MAG: helix-turn-helix transcriptional regulator [Peptococcia bacterium]
MPKLGIKKVLRKELWQPRLSNIEKDINFSPAAIALYELGLRTPSLQKAKLIARYFGVPVEDIIFGPSACEMQEGAAKKQPHLRL